MSTIPKKYIKELEAKAEWSRKVVYAACLLVATYDDPHLSSVSVDRAVRELDNILRSDV